jgi:excisionase family DNA binding protein
MEAENIERPWLKPAEAADRCGVDRVTLWRARKRGELRAGGPGRAVRFHRDELDRWMRGNKEY